MRVPPIAALLALTPLAALSAGCGDGDGGWVATTRLPGTFQSTDPARTFLGGGPPVAAAEVDWDGDGDRDLVTANEGSDDVTVLLSNGRGGYDVGGPFPAGTGPAGVAAGYLDVDGKPDLAVSNGPAGTVSILLQGPVSTARAPRAFPAGIVSPGPLVAGRFDGDPWIDLVVASTAGAEARWLRGDGLGGFVDGGPVPVSIAAFHLALGDLDGDGFPDLVVRGDGALEVLIGRPGGGFQPAGLYPVGGSEGRVVLGDMDGVPGPEVITTDEADETLSIFPNRGGVLGTPFVAATRAGPVGVAAGDLDGDGRLDLVVANEGVHFLMTFAGLGDGTVEPGLLIPVLEGCYDVFVGHLDADGVPDLTVTLIDPPYALFTMLGS